MEIATSLPAYLEHEPCVSVRCATPDLPGSIHRFYDTSPFSPSGRYLAVTQLASERRLPEPGDLARVVVVDLASGEYRGVAETRAWDTQLGAQLQWGADDNSLFYNDLDPRDWRPFGVRIDPQSGRVERLDSTVYMLSSDGRSIVSPCLRRIARTQAGYGVVVPPEFMPENRGASEEDGIMMSDVESGRSNLVISIAELVRAAALDQSAYRHGDFYLFHIKWNPQGTRLMAVLRWQPQRVGGLNWIPWRFRTQVQERLGRLRRDMILTLRPDGSDVRLALPAQEWAKGGHHPNWCPDGDRILMNLNIAGDGLRFVFFDYDGQNYHAATHRQLGSGHPTLHTNGNNILSDAYPDEQVSFGDHTTPIRWIDYKRETENTLIRIRTRPDFPGPKKELRVDPHPAWDRSYRYIAFNACPGDGRRRVFIADLGEFVA